MIDLNDRKPRKKAAPDVIDTSIIVMIAALTVAMAFAFLVEFIFSPDINWREVSANTAIVAAFSISINMLLRLLGLRKGRKTDAWLEARARMKTNGKAITEKGYAAMVSEYCRTWEQNALDSDMDAVLSRVGISLDVYREKYRGFTRKELNRFEELSECQKKAIVKAGRIRRPHYDEAYIKTGESGARHRSPSEHISARAINILQFLRIAVVICCTTAFSASVLQDIIFNFSIEAVIRCLAKLVIVALSGVFGILGGINHSTIRETDEMNACADEQERVIKWCETEKDARKVQAPETLSAKHFGV